LHPRHGLDGLPASRPPRLRLAIFDFDGTLANSLPWLLSVFDEVADRFGFRRPDPAERETMRGLGSREIVRRLGVSAWKLPRIARHIHALKKQAAAEIELFPGAADVLHALSREGVRLAIVSSDTNDNVRLILGDANARLIDHVECGAPSSASRPISGAS
jgi:phosphoglycolate phosphatase